MNKTLDELIAKNTTFAKWQLPNEQYSNIIVEGAKQESNFSGDFFIHPFDKNKKNITINFNKKNTEANTFLKDNTNYIYTKEEYLELVQNTINKINCGEIEKIVTSRIKEVLNHKNISTQKIFNSLCEKYPSAFIYCFNHQDYGTWMGASPEQLISKSQSSVGTMALAGTKQLSDKTEWKEKEIEEHKFVIDDIVNKIKELNSENINVENTKTAIAGKVKHLQTNIVFNNHSSLKKLLTVFHPTPAVCGTPTEKALEYILTEEKHDRHYYTGYLGPINKTKAELFVNLRCMRIFKNKFHLYLGGGITKSSIPEKEWEETENKAQTLLSVIENC